MQLELSVTNRVVDLIGEGVDVALRPYTPRTAQHSVDLRLRRLGGTPFALFAAPSMADVTLADLDGQLVGHPILRMAPMIARSFSGWAALASSRTVVTVDDFDSVVALISAGVGVGVAPRLVADEALASGRIVQVHHDLELGGSEVCLMWPESRHLSPRVRAFVDHFVEWVPRLGLVPPGRWPLGSA